MKLSEVFSQLASGEFSQLSIGGAGTGEIAESYYPQLVRHINLGLTELYKRFFLKEGRLKLALQAGRYTYPLTSKYAESNTASTEPVKYLLDADEPFRDDLLKLEQVLTTEGKELALNDASQTYSCFTPSLQTLRVAEAVIDGDFDLPAGYRTTELLLVYRANHPILLDSVFDATKVELELPYSHLMPLLYFVASRVHNPIGMANEFHAGNNYAMKYEQACQELEHYNLQVDQGRGNTRLERGGWV